MAQNYQKNNLVNIGGNPNDPHYRYKRQRIELEHVNRRGGLTRIKNISQIIRQLKTNDQFKDVFYKKVQKQLGIVIGKDGFFKGSVSVDALEKVLNEQIAKHLLCPRCKLPEWNARNCRACGYVPLSEKSVSKQVDEEEEEEVYCPEQARAVELVKLLYDQKPRTFEMNSDIDKFWSIPQGDGKIHEKWCAYIKRKYEHIIGQETAT